MTIDTYIRSRQKLLSYHLNRGYINTVMAVQFLKVQNNNEEIKIMTITTQFKLSYFYLLNHFLIPVEIYELNYILK